MYCSYVAITYDSKSLACFQGVNVSLSTIRKFVAFIKMYLDKQHCNSIC